jgi:hypothetical protein
MTYKTNKEIWTIEKGDWISSKYYDKQELLNRSEKET